jgi:parallel beta-helix repeat protein
MNAYRKIPKFQIFLSRSLLLLALLCGLWGGRPSPARAAAAFVVTSNIDDGSAHDTSPGNGVCMDMLARGCTLRAAIEEANAYAGADTITFANSMYILLDTSVGGLPAITEQLRLDASSTWNTANNRPGVTLNGGNRGLPGLELFASNCEVYGLFIINFKDAISIYYPYNTIGGSLQGQRNVISSNSGYGVFISGVTAHHNVIRGNWIGLSITGDSTQPNDAGLVIVGGAYENTIGGDIFGQGNYISGNTTDGVVISGANSDGNLLGYNYIGTPAVGSSNVGNGAAGVIVHHGPQNTQIGGGSVAGNLIAYNVQEGVVIWDAHSNWVETNIIISNQSDGVYVTGGAGNQILSNTIAGNTSNGVYVTGGAGNPILANNILSNGGKGIELVNGGNTELAAPTITTANAGGAWGTACAFCVINLFSDSADEGGTYEDFANADGNGNWSYTGALTGPNVTATNTNGVNNTSEFSAPKTIQFFLYLPLILKDH